ncbi:hypothetical protein [Candidatus Pelagibacter sp. HIMB1485]|uniref:hypothetical protein n=1 Tax=Candidatus Pelagibacter sp. HIMB1485 TaxID=3415415 RepID=UPI003F87C583
MSEKLQLLQNDNVLNFSDIKKQSGFVSRQPSATPRDGVIYLSSSTYHTLKLEDYSHCKISTVGELKECERLYFRLNNEPTSSDNYLILKGKQTQRAGAVISGTSSIATIIPRYASLLKKPINQRKIDLKKCEKSGFWYMRLIPDYEYKVHDLDNPPKEKVIYKIIYNGHIQNIGETNNLPRRLKEKKNQGVPMDEVYYSLMNTCSDDERKNWESFHIKKYVKEHGGLPPHNYQLGRNITQ